MVCLTSLPSHSLLDITSYLDLRTLKFISPLHPVLREVCDIHLFHTISVPIKNPYLRSIPTKPDLAGILEGYGWKDDVYESNHLDASLRYFTILLGGREGYIKELSIDLKDRYHDPELDFDNLTNPTTPSTTGLGSPRPTPIDKYQDPPSELDRLRLQASLIRQSESPSTLPHLANTFSSFPILPAVQVLRLTIYESFQGYLPYLIPLLPNLSELVLKPHELLSESPLSFPEFNFGALPRLRKLRIEPMLDSLRTFVGHLLRAAAVEELVLSGGRWTMNEALADTIRDSTALKRVEVDKRAGRSC